MKIDLHLEITNDSGTCQSIALCTTDIDATASIPTLGLSLADGKAFLSRLQTEIVSAQIAAINAQRRVCPLCHSQRGIKDYHPVNFRSLFGKVCVRVPRFQPRTCGCPSEARRRASANGGFQRNLSSCKANWLPRCRMRDRRRS